MSAIVEKMSAESEQIKSKKGRKASKAKNDSNTIADSSKATEESSVSTPPARVEEEADKENRGVSIKKQGGRKKETLKNVSNLLPASASLEDELQEMTIKLQKMNLEKERMDKLLEERDALLKEKDAELQLKEKNQEKLQENLKKLQKMKEFKPVISFPLDQSLHNGEHAKDEKKKKKADTSRQKKPSTPYILWVQDQWNQVKSENPCIAFKDMGAIMGAKWKALSAEEKKPYEEKYESEKEAYLQVVGKEKRENEALKLLHEEQKHKTALDLLEQYLQYKKVAEEDEKSKRKKEKDPLKPKQPLTAFFAFTNERRAALLVEKHNVLEISKILGKEWSSMSKEERAPYEQIAAEAKESYNQEMDLYKQKKAEEASSISREEEEHRKLEREQALRLLRKKEKEETLKKTINLNLQQKKQEKEKKADPNKPKKPLTSFFLFSKETRKKLANERSGISNDDIISLISIKWKDLGDAEKQMWEDQAARAMVQYKKEMEEYKKNLQQTQDSNTIKPQQKKQQKEKNTDPNRPKKPPSSFLIFRKETRKKLAEERPGISNAEVTGIISIKWRELGDAERQIWDNQAANAMVQYKKEMKEYTEKVKTQRIQFSQEEMEVGSSTSSIGTS
ncbi:hypothetical protein SUGI_0769010 [Cryptomeria japonica]|uniref:high mobility group B protein 6 n=1 Tax=Cryptomeria japonica TaxID=3369 RepID=UPI0024149D24|nr:high mobility group B protein 6 [Cryptomeria japonica]GLJ37818.1 hypothetical protein SUGI_0769010 [Cryptomeria japonica]